MKRSSIVLLPFVAVLVLVVAWSMAGAQRVSAQQPLVNPPRIPFDSVPDYFKYPATMNLGEVLGVAVNSKGHVLILNHPGSATSGPLYGNATTQLLEFDETGKFVREVGQGVYGLGYAHGVRYDKYDNLWVVDKGTQPAMKFNPAGYVTLNLGRRPEGPDEPATVLQWQRPGEGRRRGPSGAAARRRKLPRADRRRLGQRRQHLHQRRLHRTRAWPSSTSTETGSNRGDRAAPAGSTPTRIPASSTRRTTSASTARTTSTSPTAATAASRCSIATASSSASSS